MEIPELLIGRLLTEGYIDHTDEIEKIILTEGGTKADIFLTVKTDARKDAPDGTDRKRDQLQHGYCRGAAFEQDGRQSETGAADPLERRMDLENG